MEANEVRVVRPFKVMALLCVLFAIILIFVSVLTSYWLESEGFHQGLWSYCLKMSCESLADKIWVVTCGVACAAALVAAVVAFVFILLCLLSKQQSAKVSFYIAALIGLFSAMICLMVALIVFPVMFVKVIQEYRTTFQKTQWYFSWSYGICWGAWFFLVGAAILLLIDRVRNKPIRREKGFCDTNL